MSGDSLSLTWLSSCTNPIHLPPLPLRRINPILAHSHENAGPSARPTALDPLLLLRLLLLLLRLLLLTSPLAVWFTLTCNSSFCNDAWAAIVQCDVNASEQADGHGQVSLSSSLNS